MVLLIRATGNQRRCPGIEDRVAGGRGKHIADADRQKLTSLQKDQDDICGKKTEASLEVESADHHSSTCKFSRARDTVSNVAIAIGAISVLTNRKSFWMVSLAFGVSACGLVIQGAFATDGSRPG